MWPRRSESDEIRQLCVELRTQGVSLGQIAEHVRARFGRSFSKQAVSYHLYPRDGRGAVRAGLSDPPGGWLHPVTVRRLLGVTMDQIDYRLWPRCEIRIRWTPPGPGYLSAEDVARVWPARWRRAVERTAAEASAALGRGVRPPAPDAAVPGARDSPIHPAPREAPRVSLPPRELRCELVDFGERPAFPVWRYSRYRSDALYPRVVLAVVQALDERGSVDAVEVLTRLSLLAPGDVERWRRGQASCLEALLRSVRTVGQAARVLGILRMHAIERGLVARRSVFLSDGARARELLRFTYDEDVNLETAYGTRYVLAKPLCPTVSRSAGAVSARA